MFWLCLFLTLFVLYLIYNIQVWYGLDDIEIKGDDKKNEQNFTFYYRYILFNKKNYKKIF